MDTCQVQSCNNPGRSRGYCTTHYIKALKNGTLPRLREAVRRKPERLCIAPNCQEIVVKKNMCNAHYLRMLRHGKFELSGKKSIAKWTTACIIDGCARKTKCRGLCNMHYLRQFQPRSLWAFGAANRPEPLLAPKGSGTKDPVRGKTIYTPDGRRMAEHRYAAEKALNRRLEPNELVHHLDGNKFHNDPKNLVVLTRRKHAWLHRVIGDPCRPLSLEELKAMRDQLDILIHGIELYEASNNPNTSAS